MNEERLFDMLTDLKVHAATTNERLQHYNESLDKHIKRTELLEKDMQTALIPVKVFKLFAVSAAATVPILTILKILGKL